MIKANTAKEAKENLINVVGNVVGELKFADGNKKNGEKFEVVNFSVVSKAEDGNKYFTNCAAYNDKMQTPKEFKHGDFVKIFGKVNKTVGADGKEYTTVTVLKATLLKSREQMKTQKKASVISNIKANKEQLNAQPAPNKGPKTKATELE